MADGSSLAEATTTGSGVAAATGGVGSASLKGKVTASSLTSRGAGEDGAGLAAALAGPLTALRRAGLRPDRGVLLAMAKGGVKG